VASAGRRPCAGDVLRGQMEEYSGKGNHAFGDQSAFCGKYAVGKLHAS